MAGIILENIETLTHYQTMKDKHSNAVEDILQYVSDVITDLPWYFRFPVIILAGIIGMLCLIATGHMLNVLSSEKRSVFLRRVRFIPFFGMLNKLVRSMAFLKLFDSMPLSTDYIQNINFESN